MKFIPWHNTQSLAKGITALNRMYNSLPDNSALKLFLDVHCIHLLSPLEGNTGIPVDYGHTIVLKNLPDMINLGKNFNARSFLNLPEQVGVYVFFSLEDQSPTQCGSSIAFVNRIRTYYHLSDKEFLFGQRRIDDFLWVPVKYSKDYLTMFNISNEMTPEQEVILLSFMQQEIRSLEQAYSTYVVPSNYKHIQISTWHNNWEESSTGHTYTSKRISWTTEDGTKHTRNSIDAGVLELGFNRKYVRKIAKLDGATLVTSKYGKVTIHIEGMDKVLSFDKRYNTPINTFVNTTDLKPKFFYLYDKDMNPLPYGPYVNARKTNQAMGLPDNYGGTHLWTNYMHLIYAPALNMSVYIVKYGEQAIPVIVESVSDGTLTEYPSMSSALGVIAPGKTYDTHLLRNIVRGKPLSYKGGPSNYIRFKRTVDLEYAIRRYLAFGYKL